MPVLFTSVAAGSVAASSSTSFSAQPFIVLIFVGAILVSSFLRAAGRKSRSNRSQNPANHQQPTQPHPVARPQQGQRQRSAAPSGRTGVAHTATNVPYVGTLLNGVPLKGYDTSHGHQTTGFANERMLAEAELKRQLDALDAARRNGQVTAEQYAVHREAIFKNF